MHICFANSLVRLSGDSMKNFVNYSNFTLRVGILMTSLRSFVVVVQLVPIEVESFCFFFFEKARIEGLFKLSMLTA